MCIKKAITEKKIPSFILDRSKVFTILLRTDLNNRRCKVLDAGQVFNLLRCYTCYFSLSTISTSLFYPRKIEKGEKKYIQQTAVYFKSSLKFLLCFLPVYGFFDCYNFYALLIVVPLWFCRPLYLIRGVFFVLSLTLVRSEFVSLLMD